MENTQRIAQLFMLYTLGQLSHTEESELNIWRLESKRNEEVFQFETNRKNIADMYREIEEKKETFLQRIMDGNPQIWGKTFRVLFPRIPIPRWAEVAMYFVITSFCSYMIYQNWDKGHVVPGGYKASLLSFNGIDRQLEDVKRGFNDSHSHVRAEKDQFGNLVYYTANDSTAAKDKYNILYTPMGGYYNIRFPDGTHVILNALSSIKYPANYNQDSIQVILKGEAYFEVNRDSLHPLIVNIKIDSGDASIHKTPFDNSSHDFSLELIRGRFNLKAYPDEPFITATMLQGKAALGWDGERSTHGNSLVEGNYAIEMHGSLLMAEDEDSTTAIAWKNGRFLYKEAGIRDIMSAISKWYDVPLTYHDSISVRSFHMDLPRNAPIQEVFNVLMQQRIYCDIEDRRIHIRNFVKD